MKSPMKGLAMLTVVSVIQSLNFLHNPVMIQSLLRNALVGILLFLVSTPSLAQPNLGHTDFANSGAAEAQEPFLRGLLLLHSFEYEDAREAFQEAQHIDPNFAMAYWGEAMTHNHPIWGQKYKEPALKALSKLDATTEKRLKKVPTDREKAYLTALDLLFAEGTKLETDRAYAAKMEEIYRMYPEDLDAAAFYALALRGTSHGNRDFSIYMKAAAVAEVVFGKNPNHPGAAHYLIHLYDDPVHAPLGLRPATSYASIAPSAAHALHMPSHIFVALGMWNESASTNTASYKASVDRAKRQGIAVESHHALSWLIYDQLQLGRYEDARATLKQMHDDMIAKTTPNTRFHYAVMQSNYVLETEMWEAELSVLPLKSDDNTNTQSISSFIAGLQAINQDKLDEVRRFVDKLEKIHTQSNNSNGAKTAYVFRLELEALLKQKAGKTSEAIALLKQATLAEDEMRYTSGPPRVVKPSFELLGEVYLADGQFEEAMAAFTTTLTQRPGRSRALKGLAKAARKAGDEEVASKATALLKANWHAADKAVVAHME